MLVLSRQRDEMIMIGDDIEIVIVDIRGNKVRIGIKAPTSIGVHRKEVYELIEAEKRRQAAIEEALGFGGRIIGNLDTSPGTNPGINPGISPDTSTTFRNQSTLPALPAKIYGPTIVRGMTGT